MLAGDNLRQGLNRDLGFTEEDRVENIRRVGEVARLFVDAGLIVLCAFISPFQAERQMVRELVADDEFIEVFVDTPLEECMRRDPKGLYAKGEVRRAEELHGRRFALRSTSKAGTGRRHHGLVRRAVGRADRGPAAGDRPVQ
jgi:bifunctional enzyme CysN/CysC